MGTRICHILLFVCAASLCYAQRVNRTYNDVSLSEALLQLSQEQTDYTISFIYNELEDFRITTTVEHKSLPEAIRQMIGFYPVRMTVADHDIFVECVQKTPARYKGTVVDEQNLPLPFANVVLLSAADSAFIAGGVTNESGYFAIPRPIPTGEVGGGALLRLSFIGYRTLYLPCPAEDLGTIQMELETQTIKGVVIKGKRPQYQMNGHGLTVNVQGTMLSEAGTAHDVLGLLPGVDAADGSFNVVGKGEPLIYVNGRQLHSMEDLERLSAKDIASIELDTNPGAKYDATVSAVIRIKTVKKAGDGLSGSGRLWARQGYYGSASEQVNLNYRWNGLDIFGEVSHQYHHNYQKQRGNNQAETSTDHWQELQPVIIKGKYHRISSTLGVNCQITDNHSVGVRYDMVKHGIGYQSDWPMTETVYKNGEQVEKTEYDTRMSGSYPLAHMLNVYYNGKVGKLGIDSNTDYYFIGSRVNQDITETNLDLSQNHVNSSSRQRSELWATKLVLDYPVAAGNLEGGYEYTHTSRTDRYTSLQQLTPSSDDHIREQMAAGFFSCKWTIGKMEVGAGLRYEHVTSDYYSFGAFQPEQSRSYNRLFPNADVAFPIGKAKITLAYTQKTTRPSYWQLRSFVQYDSRYLYEAGNPLLRPAIRHDISLSGIYKWVYVSLSYQRTKDFVMTEVVPYENDSPINLFRWINYDHLTQFTTVVSLSPKIGGWSPTWQLTMYQQRYESQTKSGTHTFETPIIQPRWTNFVDLGRRFTLYAQVNGRTAGHLENTLLKPSWQVNLGISRQWGGWELQLRAYDLFRTARESLFIRGYSATFEKWNYSDSQNIQLTVTYRFNTTRSKYKGTGAGNDEKNRL